MGYIRFMAGGTLLFLIFSSVMTPQVSQPGRHRGKGILSDDSPVKIRGGSLRIHGANGWTELSTGNPDAGLQYTFNSKFAATATITLSGATSGDGGNGTEAAYYNWELILSFRDVNGNSDASKQLFVCTQNNGAAPYACSPPTNAVSNTKSFYLISTLEAGTTDPLGEFRYETLDGNEALLYSLTYCGASPYAEGTICNHVSTVEFIGYTGTGRVDHHYACTSGECTVTINQQ